LTIIIDDAVLLSVGKGFVICGFIWLVIRAAYAVLTLLPSLPHRNGYRPTYGTLNRKPPQGGSSTAPASIPTGQKHSPSCAHHERVNPSAAAVDDPSTS
jgi:hypothetical protein